MVSTRPTFAFFGRPLGAALFGYLADRHGRRNALTGSVIMVRFGSLVFALILQPLCGALSDRIGRKPLLIGFGVPGMLGTVPLLTTLQHAKSPFAAFLLICAAWTIASGYTSIAAIVKAELFPTAIRAMGVGIPYALTVAIFGGSINWVALA
jgi:MFS transporter, MHS family, alpha-ketoglutarate permease